MNLRNIGALLVALMIAALPAFAQDAPQTASTTENNCTEVAQITPVATSGVASSVPSNFSIYEPAPGKALLVVVTYRCDSLSADGSAGSPGVVSIVGPQVDKRNGEPLSGGNGTYVYALEHATDNAAIRSAFRSLGMPTANIVSSSFAAGVSSIEGSVGIVGADYSFSARGPAPIGTASELNGVTIWSAGRYGDVRIAFMNNILPPSVVYNTTTAGAGSRLATYYGAQSNSSEALFVRGSWTSSAVVVLSITSITPGAVCQSGPDFQLTIDGGGFVQGAVVQLDQSPRSTTFVSNTRLRALIRASDIASPAARMVRVVNPDKTGSGLATLTVSVDTTAPAVIAPAGLITLQTMCSSGVGGGATGATAPALASYLAGGSATDNCADSPARLAPQVSGNDVSNSTVFPVGTTTVTFRYRDNAGNIGRAASTVTVRLYGDLNADNRVDTIDLVIMANYLVHNVSPETAPFIAAAGAADLNRDGKADAVDLVLHANYLVGNISCLPTN